MQKCTARNRKYRPQPCIQGDIHADATANQEIKLNSSLVSGSYSFLDCYGTQALRESHHSTVAARSYDLLTKLSSLPSRQ